VRRRTFLWGAIALSSGAAFSARAQERVWRVGFLAARSRSTASHPDIYYDAFTRGMRELGYTEGKNLVIEWRYADGDYTRLPRLAAELAGAKVDVLVTHVTPAVRALRKETKSISIAATSMVDPVGNGFAASLARPGGNVTGLSNIGVDLTPKRLELLKVMLPRMSRIALLLNPANPSSVAFRRDYQNASQQAGIQIVPINAVTPDEVQRGFQNMARERVAAVVITNDGFFLGQSRQIADLAKKSRLPAMSPYREITVDGGLMSYGQDFTEDYRHIAEYVDRIFKGARPADMPIEQPRKLELVINRKTARALGLSVPQDLLARADEVIE
jgi:ABC-type uncharacterized transport system substrate-binding protein